MHFPQTRWTLILSARGAPERQAAVLRDLLALYWQPLYLYLRAKGLAREDAEDTVQSFAAELLEKDFLSRLDPGRGRLRGYLKTALNHHLSNRREHEAAKKRGGGAPLATIDVDVAEQVLAGAGHDDPERAYQRAWAASVFERALARLRREFEAGERTGPLDVVLQYFRGDALPAYKDLAAEHRMSVVQLKSLLHRARARFRELVREEVADTLATPDEIDAEMGELLRAL